MDAIEWMLDIPRRNSEREFLIDTVSGETLTFGAMHEAGLKVGADLRDRGLSRGDRVAMLLHNSADFAKLYFGCLYSGLVAVPINPVFGYSEVAFIMRHSGARLIVVSPDTFDQVATTNTAETETDILVLLDERGVKGTPPGAQAWDIGALMDREDFTPFDGASPQDTMTIVYTSGTTAMPSGVVHRIADLIDNARLFNDHMGIGPENRFYGVLAMAYLGGYYNLLMLPYAGEASVVLTQAFDARLALDFWNPADAHGVNTLWLVPTIASILMETDRGHQGENFCLNQVRLALIGTAPLPLRLRQDFEARYGITLYENYALSETLFMTTNTPRSPVVDGSVGRLLPGIQLSIVDGEDRLLSPGLEGEISVRSPFLMEGYFLPELGQPDLQLHNGWFHTGDIGVLSEAGDLFVTGRKKDLIIRGGVNISPMAIENVLYQHPAVVECAVVGIPHAYYGEDLAAAVRLAAGYVFEEVRLQLLASSKENLGPAKMPSHIIELEALPLSSSGKIQKVKVREILAHRLSRSPSNSQ